MNEVNAEMPSMCKYASLTQERDPLPRMWESLLPESTPQRTSENSLRPALDLYYGESFSKKIPLTI